MQVLRNPDAPAPNFPYAAMLHEYVPSFAPYIARSRSCILLASGNGSGLRPALGPATGAYTYVFPMTFNKPSLVSDMSLCRFFRAVESWMKSQVEQARNRATYELPSVEDFIIFRRRTIGGHIAEGASRLKCNNLYVAVKLMTA